MNRALKLLKPVLFTGAAATGLTIGTTVAAATVGTAVLATFAVRRLRSRAIADNSVILITGGSRGLGLAIASRFARHNVRLVLAARNREELETAQAELLSRHPHLRPSDFYLVAADLAIRTECERLIAETIAHFGRIDVLVNNAGIIDVGPIEAQSVETFEHTMRVNFFSALYTTWAALPHLRTQHPLPGAPENVRARIVNITSIGGKVAVPHLLPYSAAKFAFVGFSEGLHAELRSKGIRITTVCPGLMRTGGESHAHFHGNIEAEQRWFDFCARTPGIATTAAHAANRIYAAVSAGRAEITITPQAWLAARFAGLCPETTQCLSALTNRYVLPKAS